MGKSLIAALLFAATGLAQFTPPNGGGGGSGTVTSVGGSFTGGLISVGGSPVTNSGTLALTVAGTSGGIPYFSSASTWASSSAGAAGNLIGWGGAGVAPTDTSIAAASVVQFTGSQTAGGLCFYVSGQNMSCGPQIVVVPGTGSFNSTQGVQALGSNTTGSYNSAQGYAAGFGTSSANANTTGSNNSFFGYQAAPGSSTQQNFMTVIGSQSTGTCSGCVVLGRLSFGDITYVGGLFVQSTTPTTGTTLAVIKAGAADISTTQNLAFQNNSGTVEAWINAVNGNALFNGTITYNGNSPPTNSVVCYKAGGVMGYATNTAGVIGTTCN